MVGDLRAFLEGSWDLSRLIEDRLTNAPGRYVGRAVFVSSGDGSLTYEETGRLTTADFDDDVRQGYMFRFPEAGIARVSFLDGRNFHDLDLRSGHWEAQHLCDPDVYDGSFRVGHADNWQSQWIVKGPRKDMTISTTYTRST